MLCKRVALALEHSLQLSHHLVLLVCTRQVVSATLALLLHKALHASTRSEKTWEYGQASDPVSIVDVLHTRIIQHATSLPLYLIYIARNE